MGLLFIHRLEGSDLVLCLYYTEQVLYMISFMSILTMLLGTMVNGVRHVVNLVDVYVWIVLI